MSTTTPTKLNKNATEIKKFDEVDHDMFFVDKVKAKGADEDALPSFYIKYGPSLAKSKQIFIQSPDCKLFTYGVPSESPDYATKEEDRMLIRIPFPEKDGENYGDDIYAFREFIEALAEKFGSKEMKKYLFGADYRQYTFKSPLIDPVVAAKSNRNKKKSTSTATKYFSTKFKFDRVYDKAKNRTTMELKTTVFRRDPETKKRIIQKKNLSHPDEIIANHIGYMSTVQMVFKIATIYVTPVPNRTDEYSYGLTLKIVQVQYEKSDYVGGGNVPKDGLFDDGYEDAEEDSTSSENEGKTKIKKKGNTEETDDSNDKKKTNKKKAISNSSESEEATSKPTKSKKKTLVDSDEKPKRKTKKPVVEASSEDSAPPPSPIKKKGKGKKDISISSEEAPKKKIKQVAESSEESPVKKQIKKRVKKPITSDSD